MPITVTTITPSTAPYTETWEVKRMLRYAQLYGQPHHRLRNILMIYFSFYYGLRTREIAGLKWSDLSLDEGLFCLERSLFPYPLEPEVNERLVRLQKMPIVGNHTYVFAPVRRRKVTEPNVVLLEHLKTNGFQQTVQNFDFSESQKVHHIPMVGGSIRSLLAEISGHAVGRRVSPSMLRNGAIAHLQHEKVPAMAIRNYTGAKVGSWYEPECSLEAALDKISYNNLTNATTDETS